MLLSWHRTFLVSLLVLGSSLAYPLEENDQGDEAVKRFDEYQVLRVSPGKLGMKVLSDLEQYHSLGIDFWGEPLGNKSVDICVPPGSIPVVEKLLNDTSSPYEVLIQNVQSLIDREAADNDAVDDRKRRATAEGSRVNIAGKYLRYGEINDWLQNVANLYPHLAKLITIGASYELRPMKVLKLGKPKAHTPYKPSIWIDAGIHGREWIGPSTVLYIIHQLISEQSRDPIVSFLMDEFDWYFLPVVNPDGYEHSHTRDRLWRKTRSRYYRSSNCIGVDANRNFDFSWGKCADDTLFSRCSSTDPCENTYQGPHAFSEAETKAMGKFIYLRRNLFKLYLSFHSYSQLWLTNWGHTQDSPPDSNDIMSLARYGADMLKKKHGTTFKVGSPASILYSAAGASFDWAKGVAKIKYAYTLELRDTGRFGFILPPNQILPVGEEVWGAVKSIAARIYHEVRDAKDMFYTV